MSGPDNRRYEADAPTLVVSSGSGSESHTVEQRTEESAAVTSFSSNAGSSARSMSDAATDLEPGTLFTNRYEIVSLLGKGGMGAVYKAQDLELERLVALKVIRRELSNNPEIVQRFKQELILARQVTDRNIIRNFDLGEFDGTRFISMEYVEGQTLNEILKARGRLEVGEAVEIVEQVAAGLSAAHREGIIHRDLKPDNIIRDFHGRVVIMDFGLARTVIGDGMTQTGAMLGTLEYMSPEQALGKELKPSSDVFTTGLILYELLSGKRPYQAESAIASLLMRTQKRAAPLSEHDRNIPGRLSMIVAKCLETDPENRYPNAEELRADLRAWQSESAKTGVSVSSVGLQARRIREVRWPRFALAGILILAIAAVATWFVSRRQPALKAGPHAPMSVLIADFANHTGDPVFDNTLEPMLGLALEGASFINTYNRGEARKLAEKLPNPSQTLSDQIARLVAINQGVEVVITGAIGKQGDGYHISATAQDALTGKVLAKSDVRVADKQDIISNIPRLAAPLREGLGDTTPASEQFNEVSGGFKATSIEAVHQDALGVEEQFAGNFQEAFDSFQKAAQMDPSFARAYTGMAAMAQNLGEPKEAVNYMKEAMKHEDAMTERERYRDRGLYYLTTGDWQNCVQEYQELVARYPADRVGLNNLATCYTNVHNAPKALEAAKKAVALVPRGVGQRLNLAFISAFAGDFAGSEKEAQAALAINPKAAQGYLTLAEAEMGQGHLDQAAASYDKLAGFGPLAQSTATVGLADLDAYQGKYSDAVRLLQKGAAADVAAKMNNSAARKYAEMGNIEELEGKHSAALADTDKALTMSQSTDLEFLAANTYIDAGDLAKAEKIRSFLSSALSIESQAYGKMIDGMIALKRNDNNEGVRDITAANGLLDTWIGHFDLGLAYLKAGAFPQADSEFDECTRRRGEAIELFMDNVPTYEYFPPVYYYEGRVRQGMNSTGYPNFYKTYLSIRGQSTEDPLAADARRRLSQ